MIKKSTIVKNLLVFGLSHALIDFISALILFSFILSNTADRQLVIFLVILYNILAFGTQIIFGELSDKYKKPKEIAVLGLILGIISLTFFISLPIISIVIIGLGNALFHVGAGTIGLNLTPKKATAPGILVAPGAIGLFLGTIIAKFYGFSLLIPTIISFILITLMIYTKIPKINYRKSKSKIKFEFYMLILLLLLTIFIRSFIGSSLAFSWKSELILLIILTISIFLGKSLGGIIADKYGFAKSGVLSLIFSAILLSIGQNIPAIAIIGMFLFNITMPITLVAISNLMPGKPGFSFGLTCMALLLGTLPFLIGTIIKISNTFLFVIIILSSITLYFGLKEQKE
jgi:FSR family fosmidomycin resistance protein-like MFS transporter